jgi:hypothetical protein
MIIKCYEEIFKVTETLQNGKERTCKKSVLCPIFKAGRHVIEFDRIDRAIVELGDLGYYDIEHIETKLKKLIVTDNLEVERGL